MSGRVGAAALKSPEFRARQSAAGAAAGRVSAARARVFRSIVIQHVKPWPQTLGEVADRVRNDWGSVSDRSVLRALNTFLVSGRVVAIWIRGPRRAYSLKVRP